MKFMNFMKFYEIPIEFHIEIHEIHEFHEFYEISVEVHTENQKWHMIFMKFSRKQKKLETWNSVKMDW